MNRTRQLILLAALAGLLRPLHAADPVPAKNARDVAAHIDRAIGDRLKEEKVPPSPQTGDAEFLRRVCLDITGIIPSAERARAFLDSKDADKRARLIDELLASKDYGRHLADIWQGMLLGGESSNQRMRPDLFYNWLCESFNDNKPWDRMVRELLTAQGQQDKDPAVTYFLANETVDSITDNVSRNLLGVQLQCAQCHNHPFTGWKQNEYWGMAAFFMKVRADNVNKASQSGVSPGVTEGLQLNRNKRTLPESAKIVSPKFLGGEQVHLDERKPFRPVLASWMVSTQNPFFAKAMVNRIWGMYFGRGLVHPVDDMHENNSATHPALLDSLAASFVASGYDLKELIRAITLSQPYQRTSKPAKGNEDPTQFLYARMNIKVLSGEMLYDSMVRVYGSPPGGAVQPAKSGKGVGRSPRDGFVGFFRGDDSSEAIEYSQGIPQALRLMNSSQFNRTAIMDRLLKNSQTPEEVIEQLYLMTLARRPSMSEKSKMLAHVKKGEARHGYSDILWVLLNSSEFALNR